jgi:hypothetical protein
MPFIHRTNTAKFCSYTGTAGSMTALAAGKLYKFQCTSACYIKQTTAGTAATAAAGSSLVQPGDEVYIHGSDGTTLSVVQAAAAGTATLTVVALSCS